MVKTNKSVEYAVSVASLLKQDKGIGKSTKKLSSTQSARQKKMSCLPLIQTFVRSVKSLSGRVIVAIDPGTKGAIAMLCGKHSIVFDIPRIEEKKKKVRRNSASQQKITGKKSRTVDSVDVRADLGTIVEVFNTIDAVSDRVDVVLEKVPVTMGFAGRKFAEGLLNRAYAMWPLFITAKGYRLIEVAPDVWKKSFSLVKADKEEDRLLAVKFFPDADIKRKKDHDRADALLLALYQQKGSSLETQGA